MEINSPTEETQTEDAAASSYENFLTKWAKKQNGTIKDTIKGVTAQAGLQYKAVATQAGLQCRNNQQQ